MPRTVECRSSLRALSSTVFVEKFATRITKLGV
jgi:hypothetical protein